MRQYMIKKITRLMACAIIIASHCILSPAAPRVYSTFGLKTCRVWSDDWSVPKKDGADIARLAGRAWVAGYVSGINKTTNNAEDLLKGLDIPTITDWITQYCGQNPEADVIGAMNALFSRLKRAQ